MINKPQVCIISPEVVGPHKNGGVGTHSYYLACFLSQQLGQQVSFLYTGAIETDTEEYWKEWFQRETGVEFVCLPRPVTAEATPVALRCSFMLTARLVYEWLRDKAFDACHFQEMHGNGFRCFQAKRMGLAFQNTILTCTVHSSWEWICQAMQCLPQAGFEEMQAKYMERYSTEHCDLLISPSRHMFEWLERQQLKPPARKYLLPYLFDPNLRRVGHDQTDNHLIFFGRLEVRKGLLLFLETLRQMDQQGAFANRPLKVTFLGRPGYTPDGGGDKSIQKYRAQFSGNILLNELTDLGQREALAYLCEHREALVVCPSLIDNSPYAVIESLQLGLNIIAGKSGGIPELFAGEDRLFEPEPRALAARIKAGLDNQLPAVVANYDLKRSNQLWKEFCEETLPASRPVKVAFPVSTTPSIQVIVGLGETEGTRHTLEGLANQTYRSCSVTVLAGTGAAASSEVVQLCTNHGWNVVPGSSPENNLISTGTSSQYVVLLTPGCVPYPQMLETLVRSMESSGADGLSFCAEVTGSEPAQFTYEPLGPCLEGGAFRNFLGAGGMILKGECAPAHLLASFSSPYGIWSHLAEIAARGKAVDVVPEVLARLEPPHPAFSCLELDYTGQREVVRGCTAGSPIWMEYMLLNAVTIEHSVPALEKEVLRQQKEIKKLGKWALNKIPFKIKRETLRLVDQCRALPRKIQRNRGS